MIIPRRETFPVVFVNIQCGEVTWRHVTICPHYLITLKIQNWPKFLFKLCKWLYNWTTTQYLEGKHFLVFWWKSDIMATNNATWRHFLYISPIWYSKNRRFGHNFCLNGAKDFIFTQPHIKINIPWIFFQNLIRWRHFMTSYIRLLLMGAGGVVPHFQMDGARARALLMWIIFLLKFSYHISKRF